MQNFLHDINEDMLLIELVTLYNKYLCNMYSIYKKYFHLY